MTHTLKLIIATILSVAAAGIGSAFTSQAIPTWYAALEKPALNPPNWVFGPVWTILYILMAVSLYKYWITRPDENKKAGLALYDVQIALNTLWSIVFFGLRQPELAIVVIVALWLSIAGCIVIFLRTSKLAGLLLIPYLLWVSFATYLNSGIANLN